MKEKEKKEFISYGNLGDRIYGLAIVKALGGGIVYNFPKNSKFSQLDSLLYKQPYVSKNINELTFNRFALNKNKIHLKGYNQYHYYKKNTKRYKQTIIEYMFFYLGLKCPPLNSIIPWLVADKHNDTYKIVIHRSERYNNPKANWDFLHEFKGQIYCVGFEKEIHNFVKKYKAIHLQVKNINELASTINSTDIFIGNQSSPLSIAVGLGKNRIIEECGILPPKAKNQKLPISWFQNCTYNSPNERILSNSNEINYNNVCSLLKFPKLKFFI
jgi:hypothetical protein